MKNNRLYYSIIIVIITIITVVIMLRMQIEPYAPNPQIFDKLNTEEKYAKSENIEDLQEEAIQIKEYEDSEQIEANPNNNKEEILKEDKISKHELFKCKKIEQEMERSFVDYDRDTIEYLLSQLELSIKRAKVNKVEELLSQDRVIEAISISEVEERLMPAEREGLRKIVDKIGPIDNIKLMYKLNNGITPEEQQDVYRILREKLTDDDIVKLHDILGRYMRQ